MILYLKKIFKSSTFKIINYPHISIILIVLLGLLSITWFKDNLIIKAGDSFYSLKPFDDLYRYSYVWDHVFSTGLASPRSLANIPYGIFVCLLQLMGLSILNIEKILFFIFFALSGLGVYFFSRTLFPNHSLMAFTSAIFFMMNPYVLTNIWGTGFNTAPFAYALYPLTLYLFIKGLKDMKMYYIPILVLLWLIFSTASTNPAFSAPIIFTMVYFLFLYFIIEKNNRTLLFGIKYTAILSFIIFLMNCWWILPALSLVKEQLLTVGASGSPMEIFIGTSKYTTFSNIFRLLGAWTLYVKNFPDSYFSWSDIYATKTFIFLTFIIPIVSFYSLLIDNYNTKEKKMISGIALLSLITLFILSGTNTPFGVINLWLFENIPIGFIFRYNYEKLGVILAFTYSLLIGFCLNYILTIKKRIYVFITIIFILDIVIAFPFWTGDVIYPGGNTIPSYRIDIPYEYYLAEDYLKKTDQDDFRLLHLPGLVPPAYRWKSGYVGTDFIDQYFFPNKGIIGGAWTGNPISDDFQKAIIDAVKENNTKQIINSLNLANIKYIIVHTDFNRDYSFTQSPYSYRSIFNDSKDIPLIKSIGGLDIYRNNKWAYYGVYKATNITLLDGKLDAMFDIHGDKSVIISNKMNENKTYKLCQDILYKVPINTNQNFFNNPSYFIVAKNKEKSEEDSSNLVSVEHINPIELKLVLTNGTDPFFLVFSETYNPNWKLYFNDNKYDYKGNVRTNYIAGILYLFGKPLSEDHHFIANGYGNGWLINPSELDKNGDGTFGVDIFFLPQSYFYIGSLVSISTIIICIFWLFLVLVNKKFMADEGVLNSKKDR